MSYTRTTLRLSTALALVTACPATLLAQEAYLNRDVPSFMETGFTNERGDPRYLTRETNAGVRLLDGFLDIWEPRTPFVDADNTVAPGFGFPGVTPSDWDGLAGSPTDGRILDQAVHNHNIGHVERITRTRTAAEARDAYLDDRRAKGYSVVTGLGPLQEAWMRGSGQVTTILDMPAEAREIRFDDEGNNNGISAADGNDDLGLAVELVNRMGWSASTEPGKRYFKYARPWRWSGDVAVVPELEPAKSDSPGTDGGFPSGHTAEAWRDSLALAYLVPQRFQEMITRAVSLGDSRIVAGMHSPLDVIGGRMLGTASAVYNLNRQDGDADYAWQTQRDAAFDQAQAWLRNETDSTTATDLYVAAHAGDLTTDRFASRAANAAYVAERMTYGFAPIAATDGPVHVPQGAEILLATRMPYLTADQRRAVLATTALPGGLPVMNDEEGYGRMNLFAAADGYGAFLQDVTVAMDRDLDGFHAFDAWNNDIGGPGGLTKTGTGTLMLTGLNSYAGGTRVRDGMLVGTNGQAFGTGAIAVGASGHLGVNTLVDSTMANDLTGAGRFDKRGTGTLSYAGDGAGFTGRTTVEGGRLSVTGTLGGRLDVGAGGTLGGDGTVGSTVLSSGAQLLPGMSIGTLKVAGDLTLAPGAVLRAEIDGDGRADRVEVAGTARVAGASVAVTTLDRTASYRQGQSYRLIEAEAVEGRFADLSIGSDFIASRLIYGPSDVTLRLSTRGARAFAEAAETDNQRATASALDLLDQGAGTDSLALYNAVLFSDEAGARQAFDRISGEDHASAGALLLSQSRSLGAGVFARLHAEQTGAWVQATGSRAELDGDGNAAGVEASATGLMFGADGPVGEDARVGFVAGVGQGRIDTGRGTGRIEADSYHLGLHGASQMGALSLKAGLAYSRNQLDSRREVAVDSFTDQLRAAYDADLTQVYAEASYALTPRDGIRLAPYAGLTHAVLSTDGFAERGGAAALTSEDSTEKASFATLGLRASGDLGEDAARDLGWTVAASWQHAFGDQTAERQMSLSGGGAFLVSGAPIGRNAAALSVGLDMAVGRNGRLGMGYQGQVSGDMSANSLTADFTLLF
ncbi:autotransporter domain-containing protein [Paracoccus gahaiensis]|uniref:Autotransporter domain-containing protein n=1 Tax=Paracoccus gahaiensis TaxID=1706839 RepID=A0A4U0R8R5_9RHOB|nr:autotransporter domain-containing protein [Paracoccus gahaiensis]TJZ91425.1 autotransporter domain-containing protein [Paracoccus gahaiensis]